MKRGNLARRLACCAAALASAAMPAFAALERTGPVDAANGGYPAWYQDKTGLTLDFGKPLNQSELNGGWLLILPANLPTGAVPEVPFTNYSGEHFYWNATAGSKIQGGMSLVLSLEGAFTGAAAAAGDQIVFGRVRIKIASLPTTGNYKVYTPFGVYDFPGLVQGDRLFFTQDVGITCGADFKCALDTAIGPFLLPSAVPGGPEVPAIPDLVAGQDPWHDAIAAKTPYPGTGRKYVADPARLGPLTGATCSLTQPVPASPKAGDCIMGNPASDAALGTPLPARPVYVVNGPNGTELRDPNIFRVEVNGVEIPATAGGEHAFTTAGRIVETAIPGRVTVNRASYADNTTTGKRLNVFVTAFPSVNPRLPAGDPAITSNPDMGYYDTACATDAAGNPTAPAGSGVTGAPVTYYQMFRSAPGAATWWSQNTPAVIPTEVCVKDNGRAVPAYFPMTVVDEVDVLQAAYSPSTLTLSVDARSSDCVTNPALVNAEHGAMLFDRATCTSSLRVAPLMAPPERVNVTSLRGGVATAPVRTDPGLPVPASVVLTSADTYTMDEDCSPTAATACASPPSIDVLANDTLNGGPVPADAVVAITTLPAHGTASVVANQIVYRPASNYNGPELIGYSVTLAGAGVASPEAYLHIAVQPVNDAPSAVNDASGATNGKPVTINVLSNDTDPDGKADLSSAVITALPQAGASLTCNGGAAATVGTICTGGLVTFTGTGGGSVFTFGYRAVDASGAQSANAATVTMTVNATEAITIARSLFTGKTWRWQIDGTDNVTAGQTLTIQYDISVPPTYKVNNVCTAMTAATNPVIATVQVQADGTWLFDATGNSAGLTNPTNTGANTSLWCSPPKAVKISSPLGGLRVNNISFK